MRNSMARAGAVLALVASALVFGGSAQSAEQDLRAEVRGPDDKPVAGATVEFFPVSRDPDAIDPAYEVPAEPGATAVSDEDGVATAPRPAEFGVKYHVRVTAPGLATFESWQGDGPPLPRLDSEDEYTIVMAEQPQELGSLRIDIRTLVERNPLYAQCHVTARVYRASDAKLVKEETTNYGRSFSESHDYAVSDRQVSFLAPRLPVDGYRVKVHVSDFQPADGDPRPIGRDVTECYGNTKYPAVWVGGSTFSTAKTFRVTANGQRVPVPTQLRINPSAYTMSGKVTGANGAALPNARVEVYGPSSEGPDPIHTTTTSTNGTWRAPTGRTTYVVSDNVPRLTKSAAYKVRIVSPVDSAGKPTHQSEWYANAGSRSTATKVSTSVKNQVVNAHLTKFSRISGRVWIKQGSTVLPGSVEVVAYDDKSYNRVTSVKATVGSDGVARFALPQLRPGRYALLVKGTSPEHTVKQEWYFDRSSYSTANWITLGEGQATERRIILEAS